eukprot:7844676-Alexandrium_andersonii.AAC.1
MPHRCARHTRRSLKQMIDGKPKKATPCRQGIPTRGRTNSAAGTRRSNPPQVAKMLRPPTRPRRRAR